MSYKQYQTTDDKWKAKVDTALVAYEADVYNCLAGYDILRYAERGLLKAKEGAHDTTHELLFWEGTGQSRFAFHVLRACRGGFLEYKN